MKRSIAILVSLILLLAAAAYGCQGELPTDRVEIQLPTAEPTLKQESASVTAGSTTGEYDTANATVITLADGNIKAEGSGVQISGNCVTINEAGVFVATGKLTNGYILIDADKTDEVQLVLNGVDISCSDYAAIAAMQSDKLTVTLASGSVNSLSDAKEYTVETEDARACIFSNDNIIFNGGGNLNVTGNYKNAIASDDDLKFESGTYDLVSVNDGLNANEKIRINGGVINIEAGDDAMHSDELLEVNGGEINIKDCNEGLESVNINITDGIVSIVSRDDGMNGAGGADASGIDTKQSGQGGDAFAADSSAITISGGIVTIDSTGDGIDSNGSFNMEGGEVYVSGPVSNGNSALDFTGTGVATGGIFIAAGSSGMAQNFSGNTTQCAVMVIYSSECAANTKIELKDQSGMVIASYTPVKSYSAVVISVPALTVGGVYALYSNDTKLMEYTHSQVVMTVDDSGSTASKGDMSGFGGGKPAPQQGSMTDAPEPPADGSAPQPPDGGGSAPQPPTDGGTPPQPPDGSGTPPQPTEGP